MSEFKQYRRSQIAELREWEPGEALGLISVSAEDVRAGSPKAGDMIARNPKNHADQWLVAAQYFADNFEPVATITQTITMPLVPGANAGCAAPPMMNAVWTGETKLNPDAFRAGGVNAAGCAPFVGGTVLTSGVVTGAVPPNGAAPGEPK